LNIVVPAAHHSGTGTNSNLHEGNCEIESKQLKLPSKLSLPHVDFEGNLDELLVEVNKEMLNSVEQVTQTQNSLLGEVENLAHELHDANSLLKFKNEIFTQNQEIEEFEQAIVKLKRQLQTIKNKAFGW
jgi:hypothetical protein